MTPELTAAVRQLLAAGPEDDGSSAAVGDRAARACERMSQHLARLLGVNGVHTLLDRSLSLASARFAWLADARSSREVAGDAGLPQLRTAMAHQESGVALAASVLVLSTFIELLERFIGEDLVEHLLHEVWPASFRGKTQRTL